jgi:D-alanyl-D-alanine carboxypeptidase
VPANVVNGNLNARVAAASATAAGTNDMRPAAGSNDPIRPLQVRTNTIRTAPVQTAAMTPMPALVQMPQQVPQQAVAPAAPVAAAPVAVAAPAPVAALPQPAPVQQAVALPAPAEPARTVAVASADPAPVKIAPAQAPSVQASTQPSPVRADFATVAAPVMVPAAHPLAAEPSAPEVASLAAPTTASSMAPPSAAAIHAHGGWMIQIGAFDDEDEAKQHLSEAQVKVHTALAAADPFTEKVQKGDKALYRARFAGFDKTTAETACKELKRSDFQCMALKD